MDKKNAIQPNETAKIVLSKKQRTQVTVACCAVLLFISGNAGAMSIARTGILTKMNAMHFFALAAIFSSLGVSIMTPIGGKLGDIIGRKILLVGAGLISLVSMIMTISTNSVYLFLFFTLIGGLSQGAYLSTPYISVSLINEPKDVPKFIGLLASCMALGSFVGAFLTGIFSDKGYPKIGVAVTAVPLIIGIVTAFLHMPSLKSNGSKKEKLDFVGVFLLAATIAAFVLCLNFGPTVGWADPKIIAGFTVLVVCLIGFILYEDKLEKRGGSPIISMEIFRNSNYTILLFMGFACVYYQTTMTVYGPYAALNILGQSSTVSSMLTFPRTVLSIVLPGIFGAWVGRKRTNAWKAMAIATLVIALAFIPLTFFTKSMSVIVFFISFGATGISESMRSVAIAPSAQQLLTPESFASGTAITNFINSLSSTLSATISGSILNAAGNDPEKGIRNMFLVAVIVAALGFIAAIFKVRPFQIKREAELAKNL